MCPSVTLGFGMEGSFLALSVNFIEISSVFWLEEEGVFRGGLCLGTPTRGGTLCHVCPPHAGLPLPEEVAVWLDRVFSELWKSPQAILLPPLRNVSQELGCYPSSGLGRVSGPGGLLGGDGTGIPLSLPCLSLGLCPRLSSLLWCPLRASSPESLKPQFLGEGPLQVAHFRPCPDHFGWGQGVVVPAWETPVLGMQPGAPSPSSVQAVNPSLSLVWLGIWDREP